MALLPYYISLYYIATVIMKNILVFGASGYAKIVIDIIEKEKKYYVAGLIDPDLEPGSEVHGYNVLGKDEDLKALSEKHNIKGGIIAIGDNWVRKQVHDKIIQIQAAFNFVACVHPSVSIAKGVKIGKGTIIMARCVVNSDSKIGEQVIISTRASLDHDGKMDDFSSLAPSATTGGNVSIGKFTAIGLGANLIHNITVGEHSVIGAGSMVNKDIPSFKVAYGVPAKVIRDRVEGDRYL